MKRYILAVLLMSLILGTSACGYQITEDSTVTVVRATPTPEPTPTPAATPTPEPTPVPEVTYTQTESGVNIAKEDAVYVTTSDVNLRKDCSTEVEYWVGIPSGTEITSTGVSEDGEWLEVVYGEYIGYVKAEYATAVEPTTDEAAPVDDATVTE